MRATHVLAALVPPAALFAQPEATWDDFDKVSVTGADYAYLEPMDSGETVEGIEIMWDSLAWAGTDGRIAYTVNPYLFPSFTIQAFNIALEDTDGDGVVDDDERTITVLPIEAPPEQQLDYIIYQRILWEERMNNLVADQGFNYFEISASIQRMRSRLIDEGFLPAPSP